MNFLHQLLFGKKENIGKRVYIWNLCSSMIYSIQSAILLLIVTRIGGLYEAGVFSIIYTVTQTLASLGSYSMRNFQVSDVKNEYSFQNYFSSRIITCVLMVIACLGFGLIRQMPGDQLLVIFMFSMYRVVDGMEDVYHGVVQKKGRLDVVSIAMALRIGLSVIAFWVSYLFTKHLLAASTVLLLVSTILFLIFNKVIFTEYKEIKAHFSFQRVWKLLGVCFPIFFGAILYNYLVNAPKYAIDRNLTEEMQTVFNILFMPIFVINILSMFIFKPMIVRMSEMWAEGKIGKLAIQIVRQCVLICGLTLVVVICGYFAGCPVLALVYGVDLSAYPSLFALLLVFGGFAALATFLNVVLTIMRKQLFIIIGYIIAFLISVLILDKITIQYGINGAGYAYGIIMGITFVFFAICIVINMLLAKRKEKLHD